MLISAIANSDTGEGCFWLIQLRAVSCVEGEAQKAGP